MPRHVHAAHGLTLSSAIALPELPERNHTAPIDVHIDVAEVPDHLAAPTGSSVLSEADDRAFLFWIPGLARFHVTDGEAITVEPSPEADMREVRRHLLDTCVAALAHQRGSLVLDAAGIVTERGAVLFVGRIGSGKSTLLNEFLSRGYSMTTDGVCVVNEPDARSGVVTEPGVPRTQLWSAAAEVLGVDTTRREPMRPDLAKYDLDATSRCSTAPIAVHAVYELSPGSTSLVECFEQPSIDRLATVLRNTYQHRFLTGLSFGRAHFTIAAALAASVPTVQLVRPSGDLTRAGLAELADVIEVDVSNRPLRSGAS